ncbi:MAG: hypothetical protein AAF449_12340 [Myxococcota bacterium]
MPRRPKRKRPRKDNEQQLYCWGDNAHSQLGIGDGVGQQREPVRVDLKRWTDVVASQAFSCGIAEDGELFCWGSGEFGRTARGRPQIRTTPGRARSPFDRYTQLSAGWFSACGTREDRSVWCWGRNAEGQLGVEDTADRDRPTRMSNIEASQVAVGRFFTCILTYEGEVACVGRNSLSQLGAFTEEEQVSSLIFQKGWR